LFSGKGFFDNMKASFPSTITWTAEGAVVSSKAPSREKLSSSLFSHLPEVHFTLFPLLLKAHKSDFHFLVTKALFPPVLSLVKLTLPGRNIQEMMNLDMRK
jgi:hypothetical protein